MMYVTFKELGRKGRLGNQLFQIAAVVGTARRLGKIAALPPSTSLSATYSEFKFKRVLPLIPPIGMIWAHHSDEDYFEYRAIENVGNNINLSGYYQSKKYWEHCEDEIRDLFTIDRHSQIDLSNYVGIHVRRGDYLRFSNCYHQLFEEDYYRRAMELFPGEKFIIFSDDIEFCKNNLQGGNIHYSEEMNEINDLYRMTQCKGLIMANSSFSWWGAYLGDPNRKIVAPKAWFGPELKHLNTKDLYLPEWELCE